MRKAINLEIIAITMKQDKHLMYFTQIADVFPAMDGPTAISEANKILSGKAIVPAPIRPVTIRSFS